MRHISRIIPLLLTLAPGSVLASSLDVPPATVCTDSGAPALQGGSELSPGRWQDGLLPGTGWDFHYSEDGQSVHATWYAYSADGRPIWYRTPVRQWTVTGWPVGALSWQAPLIKVSLRADGRLLETEVGQVAFTRLLNDSQRLAVRWRWSGEPSSQDTCLIDAAATGFGQLENGTGPTGIWRGTGDDAYRLHWNAVRADLGDGPVDVERVHVLTFDVTREPVWLLGQRGAAQTSSGPQQEQLSLTYLRSLYAGGRPTPEAAARCRGTVSGCFTSNAGAGSLTREQQDGQLTATVDVEGSFGITSQAVRLHRRDVAMQRDLLQAAIALDREWCHVAEEVPHCSVNLAVGSDHGQVYRVDIESGRRTRIEHTEGETLVDQVPVGSYRYELLRDGLALEGAAVLAESWTLAILAPPDADSTNQCGAEHVPSGPDTCEPDDMTPGYYYGLTEYHHNFHHANDLDRKTILLPQMVGMIGVVRFEPEAPGQDNWHYEIFTNLGQLASHGTVGALTYHHLPTPPVSACAGGAVCPGGNFFQSRFRPGNAATVGVPSRYTVSLFTAFAPPNDGQDSFEIDNSYTQAKPLANGEVHQKNFHTTNERDWISLDVQPGDQQTLTFAPITASGFGTGDPWRFEIHRQEADGSLTALTTLNGSFKASPVTRLVTHPGGPDPFTYFVLVRPTISNFHGNMSRYSVGLTVVSTPQPDQYDMGAGDNTRQTATPLLPGIAQTHNFHTGSDRDWMSRTLADPGTTVSFAIQPQDPASTAPRFVAQLWTLDAQGVPQQISAANGGYAVFGHPGTTLSQVSERVDQPYWLEMYANSGTLVGAASVYQVTLTEQAPTYPPDAYEPDNAAAAAQALPLDATQLHDFHVADDQDWYKVALSPGQTVTFTLTPVTANAAQPWRWQSHRDSGSGLVAIAQANFGSATSVAIAHSGGSGPDWAYLQLLRNPAATGFQGAASRYNVIATRSGGAPPADCTLTDWTGQVGAPVAGPSPQHPGVKSYFGPCGVQVSNVGSYLVDDRPAAESRYLARFYYYTGDRSGGTAQIFQALSGTGVMLAQVEHDGAALIFRAGGSGTVRTLSVADQRWYQIALQWRAADAGSSNGELAISVTGNNSDQPQVVPSITGLANASHRVESARLGLISGSGSGTVYFDEYQARRLNAPRRLCRGDAVPDGVRDQADMDALSAQIAGTAIAIGQVDVNENGQVTVGDLLALQQLINTAPACP